MASEVIEQLKTSDDPLERELGEALTKWQDDKSREGSSRSLGYEPREIRKNGAVAVIEARVMKGSSGFEEIDKDSSYEAIVDRHPSRFSEEVVAAARSRLRRVESDTPRITSEDVRLIASSRSKQRYADLSVEEHAAYERVSDALSAFGNLLKAKLADPSKFEVRTTSGFNVKSGVRSYIPKDLWFSVSPKKNVKHLAGMPQLFMIVSERGIEYGFGASVSPSDFSQQTVKELVRKAAPIVFEQLPSPDAPETPRIQEDIEKRGNWFFRRKHRLTPNQSDYSSLKDWLQYLRSPEGNRNAAGSISRYLHPDEVDGAQLEQEVEEMARLFEPLIDRDWTTCLSVDEPAENQASISAKTSSEIHDEDSEGLPEVTQDPSSEPYGVEDALRDLFLDHEDITRLLDIWHTKKNMILQGAPGVGKSFIARRLAYALIGYRDDTKVQTVQFHQSYSYEDFVQGYRPNGSQGFERKNGTFYEFRDRALKDPNGTYIFIIDEINRGNLSKIFGELMLLIEPDKRGDTWKTRLAYATQDDPDFFVPDNLFILGLMNTADRSLSLVDYALRRRFAFVAMEPLYGSPKFRAHLEMQGVPDALVTRIINGMDEINQAIASDRTNLGPGFRIGHSFFTPNQAVGDPEAWYRRIVETEILPLLEEYWFDAPETADQWRNQLLG